MTTVMQKFALATVGAAALAVGSVAPANAFGLSEPEDVVLMRYDISGTTGSLFGKQSHYFKEYQNATFTGEIFYDLNAKDQAPDDPNWGIFPILGFLITITNNQYPDFQATIGFGAETNPEIKIDEFIFSIIGGDLDNHSQYNPTIADFNMFFNCYSGDRNVAPDRAPCGLNSSESYLTLYGVEDKPDLKVSIPLVFGVSSEPVKVEAVPEPTTMAGIGIFGFAAFLQKRMARKAKS